MDPVGSQEISRRTHRFLRVTLGYYNRVEERLEQCLAAKGGAG